VLSIRELRKRFGDVQALDGVTLDAPPGRLVGFLGRNGAGKTTAMRAIFALITPDSGTVTWNGQAITDDVRRRFGYMPEQRGLYPKMRIVDQLVYLGRLHGIDADEARTNATRLLEGFGLAPRAGDRLEQLSHGNQQRVQLAATLLHDPELLVLDEPFSGLDPVGVESMVEVLRKRAAEGASIVFSSHQLDLVEDICDDVVIIDGGTTVLHGELAALQRDSAMRVVEVRYEDATVGTRSWEISTGEPIEAALAAAERDGALASFAVRPPSVTELFKRAVTT
jgi:ABC-2 type transport system ATP-binding protein